MSLSRAPINIFITPRPLPVAPLFYHPRQVGLTNNHIESAQEPRILAEIVSA